MLFAAFLLRGARVLFRILPGNEFPGFRTPVAVALAGRRTTTLLAFVCHRLWVEAGDVSPHSGM